jgi:hypothetical protein
LPHHHVIVVSPAGLNATFTTVQTALGAAFDLTGPGGCRSSSFVSTALSHAGALSLGGAARHQKIAPDEFGKLV